MRDCGEKSPSFVRVSVIRTFVLSVSLYCKGPGHEGNGRSGPCLGNEAVSLALVGQELAHEDRT